VLLKFSVFFCNSNKIWLDSCASPQIYRVYSVR